MPNTDDIQEAVDDLGAQLEAEFADRAATDPPIGDGDGTDPSAGEGDQPAGDEDPAEGAPPSPPTPQEGDEDQPPDPEPSAGPVDHDDEAQRIRDWAARLPADVREQFGQIEAGTHQAVDRRQFEAFQQWLATQQEQGASGGPLFGDLTPEQAEYLEQLEQRARSAAVDQQRAGLDQLTATVDAVSQAYADKHKLDEQTMGMLQDHVARMQIIEPLIRAGRSYNPVTGNLDSEADISVVFERAYDLAMHDHPDLRERVYAAEATRRAAADRAASQAADGKRARAASLASVPSAALTRDPTDVRQLTPQETTARIAEELRKQMTGTSN